MNNSPLHQPIGSRNKATASFLGGRIVQNKKRLSLRSKNDTPSGLLHRSFGLRFARISLMSTPVRQLNFLGVVLVAVVL